ncbi:hypothetical protein ACFPZ0_11580 [Streptomonospora nanhaiensis]|uniref:Uncharacterized protein n=1 Tax=Streptomonospora nanhaiensis TaxID=1323731 RepID=A0A853BMV8_9ACTN|nr:hypothetical protein [Streptomonospora nanhaiensis]MBV2365747.1 hypothetical protein [Streptomonospora nanhaiensis]MBX9388898.1 hypothetical protein [Streptomonospora nanhaiensis]NYI96543.1 hypothetical protein [Streptomonospora nanhaiensis]
MAIPLLFLAFVVFAATVATSALRINEKGLEIPRVTVWNRQEEAQQAGLETRLRQKNEILDRKEVLVRPVVDAALAPGAAEGVPERDEAELADLDARFDALSQETEDHLQATRQDMAGVRDEREHLRGFALRAERVFLVVGVVGAVVSAALLLYLSA